MGLCGKSRAITRSSLEVRCDLEYKVGVKRVAAVPVEKQDEKVQKVLSLHEQAEEDNTRLRELFKTMPSFLRPLTGSPHVGFIALMELRSLVRALGGVRRRAGTSASWEVSWGTVRQP